jgi:hypothetical protein
MSRRRFFPALLLAMLALAGFARADTSGGQQICDGPYALCSSAQCQPIVGDPTKVTCSCEGPLRGQNIANSACAARERSLTSTFSLWDPTTTPTKPAKPVLGCLGGSANQWAFCLDAPCTVENGKTTCQCALKPASDAYVFASACPTDAASLKDACGKIWSAASKAELESGYSQLKAVSSPAPEMTYCPALK